MFYIYFCKKNKWIFVVFNVYLVIIGLNDKNNSIQIKNHTK